MRLNRTLLLPLALFLVALFALLGTLLVLLPSREPQGQGVASVGGPFTLTDQNGQPFSSERLKGKPYAIFFGFTHCPEVCPTTLFDLTEDLKALGIAPDKLNVVFVTVDPERDTPTLIKEYLQAFDPRIVGLTGSPEDIAGVAKAYRVYFKKVPTEGGNYTMDHTATILLMDDNGEFEAGSSFQEAQDARRAKIKRLVEG
jgi:protein SCO1/2